MQWAALPAAVIATPDTKRWTPNAGHPPASLYHLSTDTIMRTLALASLSLAISSIALAQESRIIPSTAQDTFAAFQQENGGANNWIAKWHPATGTPSTIYGTGLKLDDWRENSLAEARRHAQQVLKDRTELLGLGQSNFTEVIGARMGRTWSFTFDQSFRGIPVIEGRADVRINMRGVVAMLGSRAWPVPANFNTVPAITANVATATAWTALGGEPNGNAPAARLVIWGDTNSTALAPIFLAWEVAVHDIDPNGEGTFGRYYIDARTARNLHFISDKHDCAFGSCKPKANAKTTTSTTTPSVTLIETPHTLDALPTLTTVTVMAWSRIGVDAYDALQNVPMANLEVDVPGLGTQTTDANGEFVIDITSPVAISINGLEGTHFGSFNGANAPSGSVTVNPGTSATIQLLSAGASTTEAAHTSTAYWVDRSYVWARSILGNSAQLNSATNVGITVNITNTCNAFYSANTVNFYQAGGSCANTAFSSVIAHEWGHGLDDRFGGISNSIGEGLSEGWGDIIGIYQLDSPLLGSGFSSPGVPLRNGNNSFVFPYSSGSPHGAGQVWMGWAWRFREALRATMGTPAAIALSNQLVLGSIVADAGGREQAVLEVFIADDDDGNLLNGTPHYAELVSASVQKGIPYPEIVVIALTHSPLANTPAGLTPRAVILVALEVSETITSKTVVYDDGSGPVSRNLHPTGFLNQFRAMLPAIETGSMSYHIDVVHTGGTMRLPAVGDYTYAIVAGAFSGFYLDALDSGAAGWTSGSNQGTNDWQLGTPDGDSGTSNGISWSDPGAAVSGSNCYGNDLGNGGGAQGNGRYQSNINVWLRSPTIDCTGRTGVRLRFRRWLTVQDASQDVASIWVNNQQVWQNPAGTNTLDNGWQSVEYLVPWADNNPAVQVEWRLVTDQGTNLGGWNIDNIEIGETTQPIADAELRFTPEQVVQGGAMSLTVTTPGNSRPYLLLIGDFIGPIQVPGLPIIFVGGNYGVIGGTTDASGNDTYSFAAPNLPGTIGQIYYSQVLTLNAAFTQFVTSNRGLNWVTLIP
ncbi:MAG: hypothetical protein ACI85K_000559 [Hyphomicrobiaceae bacterium]